MSVVDHDAGASASSPAEPVLQSGVAEIVNVQEDVRGAAAEVEDSKWFRQVGERGKRVAALYRDSMSA